ncbi:MAG: hypothetical protein H7230_03605 [Candidatus Parcubacteria bacterium]|nr:hypothetical protein [Candidatus Paceibacterota bacterium]
MKLFKLNRISKIIDFCSKSLFGLLAGCLLVYTIHNLKVSQYIKFDRINDFVGLILQVHSGLIGSLLTVITFFYTFISDYNKSYSSDYLKPFKTPIKKLTNLGLVLLGFYGLYLFLTIFIWSNTIINEYIKDIKILFIVVFLMLNFKFWNQLYYLTSLILNHDNRKIWDAQIQKIFLDEFSDTDVNNRLNSLLIEVRKFYCENDINSINLILQAVLNIKKHLTKKFYFESNIKIFKKIISAIIELDSNNKLLQYQLINLITNLGELDLLTSRDYQLYFGYFSSDPILEILDYEISIRKCLDRADTCPSVYNDLLRYYIRSNLSENDILKIFESFYINLENSIKSKTSISENDMINIAWEISTAIRGGSNKHLYLEICFYSRILHLGLKYNLAADNDSISRKFGHYMTVILNHLQVKLRMISIADFDYIVNGDLKSKLVFVKNSTVPAILANTLNIIIIEELISKMFELPHSQDSDKYKDTLQWRLDDIFIINDEFLRDDTLLIFQDKSDCERIYPVIEELFKLINANIKKQLDSMVGNKSIHHHKLKYFNELNNQIKKLLNIFVKSDSNRHLELEANQKLIHELR